MRPTCLKMASFFRSAIWLKFKNMIFRLKFTCSRSGCLSATKVSNISTSWALVRPLRVTDKAGDWLSLRGPPRRSLFRFGLLTFGGPSCGVSGVINTEFTPQSASLPMIWSSLPVLPSVSGFCRNFCMLACTCSAFLFLELGEVKETKMSLSGELSWPLAAVFELRLVISFITDIITGK